MAKKSTKKTLKPVRPQLGDGVEILNAGSVLEDPITRTPRLSALGRACRWQKGLPPRLASCPPRRN